MFHHKIAISRKTTKYSVKKGNYFLRERTGIGNKQLIKLILAYAQKYIQLIKLILAYAQKYIYIYIYRTPRNEYLNA